MLQGNAQEWHCDLHGSRPHVFIDVYNENYIVTNYEIIDLVTRNHRFGNGILSNSC